MGCFNFCRYSTGCGISGGDILIHEFYAKDKPQTVHLKIDSSFSKGKPTVKAYVSSSLSLGDKAIAVNFEEVPLSFHLVDAEKFGS